MTGSELQPPIWKSDTLQTHAPPWPQQLYFPPAYMKGKLFIEPTLNIGTRCKSWGVESNKTSIIPGNTGLHYTYIHVKYKYVSHITHIHVLSPFLHFPIGSLSSFFPPLFIMLCHISVRLLLLLGPLQGSLVDQYNVDVFLSYSEGSSSLSFACI